MDVMCDVLTLFIRCQMWVVQLSMMQLVIKSCDPLSSGGIDSGSGAF